MKKLTVILLLSTIFIGRSSSQITTLAFHFNNPVSLFQKVGGKVEYRTNQMGFLFCATQYYGTTPDYPGTQIGVEWRKYASQKPDKRGENFFYTKLIAGHQNHVSSSGSSFLMVSEVPEGDYYGAGAGVGRHINYNHFFIDLNAGLKAVASSVKQDNALYISGPASFIDLHLNIGYQF